MSAIVENQSSNITNSSNLIDGFDLSDNSLMNGSPYSVIMCQQPQRARICISNEKAVDRRPLEPCPIIELKFSDPNSHGKHRSLQCHPFYFAFVHLVHPETLEEINFTKDQSQKSICGAVASSLYRLKDIDNIHGGFFVFPDISVRVEGNYRLRFSLFEIIGVQIFKRQTVVSDIFTVYSMRDFPGVLDPTPLSRCFADQGLKIRIKKEVQKPGKKRASKSEIDPNQVHNANNGKRLSSGTGDEPGSNVSSTAISPVADGQSFAYCHPNSYNQSVSSRADGSYGTSSGLPPTTYSPVMSHPVKHEMLGGLSDRGNVSSAHSGYQMDGSSDRSTYAPSPNSYYGNSANDQLNPNTPQQSHQYPQQYPQQQQVMYMNSGRQVSSGAGGASSGYSDDPTVIRRHSFSKPSPSRPYPIPSTLPSHNRAATYAQQQQVYYSSNNPGNILSSPQQQQYASNYANNNCSPYSKSIPSEYSNNSRTGGFSSAPNTSTSTSAPPLPYSYSQTQPTSSTSYSYSQASAVSPMPSSHAGYQGRPESNRPGIMTSTYDVKRTMGPISASSGLSSSQTAVLPSLKTALSRGPSNSSYSPIESPRYPNSTFPVATAALYTNHQGQYYDDVIVRSNPSSASAYRSSIGSIGGGSFSAPPSSVPEHYRGYDFNWDPSNSIPSITQQNQPSSSLYTANNGNNMTSNSNIPVRGEYLSINVQPPVPPSSIVRPLALYAHGGYSHQKQQPQLTQTHIGSSGQASYSERVPSSSTTFSNDPTSSSSQQQNSQFR